MLRSRPTRRSFVDQVRAAAAEELTKNTAGQASVSRRLGMSTATLRRRLDQVHGTRYSEVVDQLRREVAAKHLVESKLRIEEISQRAGFAQPAPFYRAFKRWFGCTPAEYRRAYRSGR